MVKSPRQVTKQSQILRERSSNSNTQCPATGASRDGSTTSHEYSTLPSIASEMGVSHGLPAYRDRTSHEAVVQLSFKERQSMRSIDLLSRHSQATTSNATTFGRTHTDEDLSPSYMQGNPAQTSDKGRVFSRKAHDSRRGSVNGIAPPSPMQAATATTSDTLSPQSAGTNDQETLWEASQQRQQRQKPSMRTMAHDLSGRSVNSAQTGMVDDYTQGDWCSAACTLLLSSAALAMGGALDGGISGSRSRSANGNNFEAWRNAAAAQILEDSNHEDSRSLQDHSLLSHRPPSTPVDRHSVQNNPTPNSNPNPIPNPNSDPHSNPIPNRACRSSMRPYADKGAQGSYSDLGIYSPQQEDESESVRSGVSALSSLSSLTVRRRGPCQVIDSARIVAPHVGKLSQTSVVEICLGGPEEKVSVLCSADVLKMKSAFFHDILIKQEAETGSKVGLWRGVVQINEAVPFEAASFLESLHESSKLALEWSYQWARLAVRWQVEEFLLEYADHIDVHMSLLDNSIKATHWRTSPEVLAGIRVAVFRKAATNTPTVITGTAVAPLPSTAYSRLRVAFDIGNQNLPEGAVLTLHTITALASQPTPLSHRNRSSSNPLPREGRDREPGPPGLGPQQIVADVGETIWVRNEAAVGGGGGDAWMEPDEYYMTTQKAVTANDRRLFWEMARAITLLPALAQHCRGPIKSPRDLTLFLMRRENRVVWAPEASLDFLPKEEAMLLIQQAYSMG